LQRIRGGKKARVRTLGRALADLFAGLFVGLQFLVVVAWIAGAVWIVTSLPSISSGGGGSPGELLPSHSPATTAERISVEQFGFPVLSRTIVVVRNPHGLSPARQSSLVGLAKSLSQSQIPGYGAIAGAVPLLNSVRAAPVTRETGTTAVLYLYFRPSVSESDRIATAARLVRERIGRRTGEFEGVTGEEPAREAQTQLINDRLLLVELATIVVVALAVGLHFRSIGSALLTVAADVLAYLVADRLVAQFGSVAGVQVPAEVQPVLIVLVFGVVTDYSIFFISRFRFLLGQGLERRWAAVQIVRDIGPIVIAAGLTVAAGTAALLVARLEFLRAFGPGLAIAVIVAMLVAVTLIPAVLAIGGERIFGRERRAQPTGAQTTAPVTADGDTVGDQEPASRISPTRLAARHPIVAVLVTAAIVGAAATGLARVALGNDLILGLPAGSQVHRAYDEATRGFTPGVIAPAVVVVTGDHVAQQRNALDRLQTLLARQPDVAGTLGPQQPLASQVGVAVSRTGNAARFALFLRSDPLGARAIADLRKLTRRLPALLSKVGLPSARALVAGDTALSADLVDDTLGDLARVAPTMLLAVFVIVAIYLRALVAPVYLVLTSLLAVFASLGLTVYVLQMLFGYGQVAYYAVFTTAVLLVSLGSDYNVFLVGQIWQEARRRSLREAVEIAGARAARPIATAGMVLGLSFALVAIVPVRAFREIAFAMALGLLIDAFIVRAILVPALMTLVGTRSAWPRQLSRDPRPQSATR
jgi:putative drug exporter of the RND superfamily